MSTEYEGYFIQADGALTATGNSLRTLPARERNDLASIAPVYLVYSMPYNSIATSGVRILRSCPNVTGILFNCGEQSVYDLSLHTGVKYMRGVQYPAYMDLEFEGQGLPARARHHWYSVYKPPRLGENKVTRITSYCGFTELMLPPMAPAVRDANHEELRQCMEVVLRRLVVEFPQVWIGLSPRNTLLVSRNHKDIVKSTVRSIQNRWQPLTRWRVLHNELDFLSGMYRFLDSVPEYVAEDYLLSPHTASSVLRNEEQRARANIKG